MYFTSDSLLPENQEPLIITAAPFGPLWLPSDYPEDIPVTWEEQVQKAVDCYNAGATLLHVHVRDPKTGHVSKNFKEYSDSDRAPAQGRAEDGPPGRWLDLIRAPAGATESALAWVTIRGTC